MRSAPRIRPYLSAPPPSLLLAALLALGTLSVRAQQSTPDQPAEADTPYVLHVYANLIQIPTLVLSRSLKPLPPIPIDRFNISLDSGPPFHPTRMHIEGDEPLSLAVLLDASGGEDLILKNFAANLAALAPGELLPHDHITIYALDCQLLRSTDDKPATAETIEGGVTSLLESPLLHDPLSKHTCHKHLHLWSAIARVTQNLSTAPGRRILLVVSNGDDGGKSTPFESLHLYADRQSVAIFGLRDIGTFLENRPSSFLLATGFRSANEDFFSLLCTYSGGLLLNKEPGKVPAALHDILSMVRGRYILEFPRADQSIKGIHNIGVTVKSQDDFITTAGVVVPLPDDQLLKDPNTVPTAASPATFGKRKPIEPPQL